MLREWMRPSAIWRTWEIEFPITDQHRGQRYRKIHQKVFAFVGIPFAADRNDEISADLKFFGEMLCEEIKIFWKIWVDHVAEQQAAGCISERPPFKASLIPGKVYRIIPDTKAAKDDSVRLRAKSTLRKIDPKAFP